MLTFADITSSKDAYHLAPRIDRDDVRLLWHVDYWDSPRSGILLYQGKPCWFQVVAENKDDDASWYRRFAVLTLSAEQLAEEQRWHELFRECVGGHTDYDEHGKRPLGSVQPRERAEEFYTAYRQRTPPDFSKCEVLGWFEH